LLASLLMHALFVLLIPQTSDLSQTVSSSRMSVAISSSQYTAPEIELVKSDEKIELSDPLEKMHKAKSIVKQEKRLIKSTNTAAIPNALLSEPKLKKTIEKPVEILTKAPLKIQNIPEIQKPKQDDSIAEAPSKSINEPVPIKEAIKEQQAINQSESVLQASSDEKKDSQFSRFQIGSNANPKPNYPSLAVKRGWQGEVILGVHVRADGSIEHLTFVKSTNYGVLNFEAYETVRTSWHFKALEDEDGQSESTYIEVPITFNIANR